MSEKNVPNIRFKGFTEDWEQRQLSEVVNIQGGGTPASNVQEYWNGKINWFTPTEVSNNGYLNRSLRKITEEGLKKSSAHLLPKGTILMTSRAGIGNMGILTEEAATNQGFQSLIPKEGVPSYFIYSLQPYISNIANKLASGSTFTEISNKTVKKIKLTIPNSDKEKNDVGTFFNKLDQLIASNQRKLDQLKEVKKLLMQKIFDQEWRFKGFTDPWEQRQLLELTALFSGLTYSPKDIQKSGTLVLRSSNIQNNEIVDADNVFVNNDVVNSKNIQKNDVIVVVRNGSRQLIGKHALVKQEMKNTVIGAFMTGLRGSNGPFINTLLSTDLFKSEVHKSLGATINQITGKDFKLMKFFSPKTAEQNIIGQLFINIDQLIASNQQKLDQLKKMKKWFMQNMFV